MASDFDIDDNFARYADVLFFEGKGRDAFARAYYGYHHVRRRAAKPRLVFPRGAKALDGYNKREPLQSRLACPDEGTDLISLQYFE